jgi:adenylate kinase
MVTAADPHPAALIFGMPGSGKGTQGAVLSRVPGFFHVSSGQIFRELDPQAPDGRLVREYTHRGELVPDDLTVRIFLDWLRRQATDGTFHPGEDLLLLDGIPRNRNQCRMLEASIDVRLVLHLVCSDEELMIARICRRARLENRPDDAKESVIRKRFDVYRQQTAPVLEHYPRAIIRDIDSAGTPAEVLLQCLTQLVPVFMASFPRNAGAGAG